MRLHCLLLAGILTGTSAFAQNDPFVGTWLFNEQKSPKPTIRYAIKDLGGQRYALTGSTGVTVRIKADGVPIQSAPGTTVSFKQVDKHDWEMTRNDGLKMVRTYNVSPDDKTLTLHDVFTGGDDHFETTTKYARLSPGAGIFGQWQSVSMERRVTGERLKLLIAPFDSGGLSFSIPSHRHLSDLKFDGKMYADSGAGDFKGHSSSGKRISDRVLQIESQVDNKPEQSDEWKVSDDGKTLTIVSRPANSPVVFTEVWDRR